MGKTKSDALAIELSTTLTIAQVLTLFFLHKSRAAYVSQFHLIAIQKHINF